MTLLIMTSQNHDICMVNVSNCKQDNDWIAARQPEHSSLNMAARTQQPDNTNTCNRSSSARISPLPHM